MENQNIVVPTSPAPAKLKGAWQLFKESWKIYLSKFKTIIAIVLIPVFFLLGEQILSQYTDNLFIYLLYLLFYLLYLLFSVLIVPAIIYCLKDNLSAKEALKRGWSVFFNYIWLIIIFNLIYVGGFLLLIIPGILFLVWFNLFIYVFVYEEKKGMNALFRSKDLVSGKFWAVVWRYLFLGIIFVIFLIILSIIISFLDKSISDISLEIIVSLIAIPLGLIYGNLFYKDLAAIKAIISYQEPQKSKKIKYVIISILGLLPVLVLLFFGVMFVTARDIPPIDDSDLQLPKLNIPQEQNAFYLIKQAVEKMNYPKGKDDLIVKIINKEAWDSIFVQETVNQNQESLNYFDQALNLNIWQDPNFQDPTNFIATTKISITSTIRNLARLQCLKAAYLFSKGQQKEAFEETIKVIKLGQMMENSQSPIIYYLVGIAVKNVGFEELRTLVAMTDLSKQELLEYISKLEIFSADKKSLIIALKAEYLDAKNTLTLTGISEEEFEELAKYPRFRYTFQPNRTVKLFADYYRQMIDDTDKKYCKEISFQEPEQYMARPWEFFMPNGIGKIIYGAIMISYGSMFDRKCQEDFYVEATQLLIALKAFQIDNSRLPNNLSELVPNYIFEIPKDAFDGQAIRYSLQKKIIYSVGDDFVDSGGSIEKSTTKEPTIQIKF